MTMMIDNNLTEESLDKCIAWINEFKKNPKPIGFHNYLKPCRNFTKKEIRHLMKNHNRDEFDLIVYGVIGPR